VGGYGWPIWVGEARSHPYDRGPAPTPERLVALGPVLPFQHFLQDTPELGVYQTLTRRCCSLRVTLDTVAIVCRSEARITLESSCGIEGACVKEGHL
jgi:hypothetical protein